jgi:hypothetical protein
MHRANTCLRAGLFFREEQILRSTDRANLAYLSSKMLAGSKEYPFGRRLMQ